MSKKTFNCKMEEVPVVAGFVVESLQEDLADFQDYSPDYTQEKVEALLTKRNRCQELVRASSVIQRLKNVTSQLMEKEKALRPNLNKLEGYVKRADGSLDIPVSGFSLKAVRDAISRGNAEGIIAEMNTLLINAKRNQAALEAVGMKADMLTRMTEVTGEIDSLNNEQNKLENQRSSTAAKDIDEFNDLWADTTAVCADARAIYKGVDEVKLKKYNISTLKKRVNAEGDRKEEEKE